MMNTRLYNQDSGNGMGGSVPPPPPPPPPGYNPPPPPPPPNYNAPPPPPPPGYNPPPPPPPYGNTQFGSDPNKASTNAILALILGIASWVIGCTILTAIPAWIIGRKELNAINEGRSSEAGRSMATIGMWLGIAHCILAVIGIIFGIIMIFFGILAGIGNS